MRSQGSDEERFEKYLRLAQESEVESLQPKQERLNMVLDLIKHCEQEAQVLAEAFKGVCGIVRRKLEGEADDLNARYEEHLQERSRLEAALRAHILSEEQIQTALRFRQNVMLGMHNPTSEDK